MAGAFPAAAQTPTEAQFIASVNSAISSLTASLPPASHSIILSGNLEYANGKVISGASMQNLLDYVDGLKAAGAQRVDLNPGVTSIATPAIEAKLDAVVTRIRQLGMRLAINPEITPGELGDHPTFDDFQTAALRNYAALAARYQPDNFVIVHEPTTATASLALSTTTVAQWHAFLLALAPAIQAASPHTRVGAGAYQNGVLQALSVQENAFFQDAVTIPALDFMTMDIYNDDTFPTYQQWIGLAQSNHKSIYIEETWAPHYLPVPLPASLFNSNGYLTESLDDAAVEGVADPDFETMDANWLQAIAQWASANGMEAITPFTTLCFFAYGTAGHNMEDDSVYNAAVQSALQQGQLSSTGNAYMADSIRFGIPTATSLSSASYATLSSIYSASFANQTAAPDALMAAFGADLGAATATAPPGPTYPLTLAGTTAELLDSSNTTYPVPLYFVSSSQIDYLVPSAAQSGPAILTIASADGTITTGVILVQPVAPGIYTAGANGQGPATALAVTVHADGSQFVQPSSQPISLGSATDTVYLELFGSGIRHAPSLAAVTVAIGVAKTLALSLPAEYAGPQGQYGGLDQVNVGLRRSLAGAGTAGVVVTAAGAASNTVTVTVQ